MLWSNLLAIPEMECKLIGTLFSETAALDGNDIATFPDFPAEIRAPHNTGCRCFRLSGPHWEKKEY